MLINRLQDEIRKKLKRFKEFLTKHWELSIVIVLIIANLSSLYKLYCVSLLQTKKEDVQVMETMQDFNYVQNTLKTDNVNTELLQEKVQESKPVKVFYTENNKKVLDIKEKIEQKSPYLPKEVLEKTDRTIVTEDKNKTKVEVYKVNLYKRWEFGIGAGVKNEKAYIPISIQRNYDKNHGIEIEGHFVPSKGKIDGGAIKWKVLY